MSIFYYRWLVPRLHSVPVLLVAITQNNTSQLVREGEQLTKQLKKAEFIQVSEDDFDSESLSEYVHVVIISPSLSYSFQSSRLLPHLFLYSILFMEGSATF